MTTLSLGFLLLFYRTNVLIASCNDKEGECADVAKALDVEDNSAVGSEYLKMLQLSGRATTNTGDADANKDADSDDWVAAYHNPRGPAGGWGHGTTVVHHNPRGPAGGWGHGTTVAHHHGGWLQEDAEDSDADKNAENEKWVAAYHNPRGPAGGWGHGTTVVHHNPRGPAGGWGHGTTVAHHHGGWLQEDAEDSDADKNAENDNWVAAHHNPRGPAGGWGHGTTVVHHNPRGPAGGWGHGTTVAHHHGGWLQEDAEDSDADKNAEDEHWVAQ